ncbi:MULTISPECIES: DUF4262 domain-containing protein [unclassified Amycolatopsis]|uniref:DUF4262 domain-containing protein n=1 Tax=unclassified Amycolatopsis TaxID=2618356 RepID=UPI002107E917|nr:DUF4262 domain-containing protein [Amycolatopsis sp. DSM 110486]
MSRYIEKVRARVDDYGWCIQHVLTTGSRPSWTYTIGLTAWQLPELVVAGLSPLQGQTLLATTAERVVSDGPLQPGEYISVRGVAEVEVVALAEPSVHLNVAVAIYGPTVRAMQLVYADAAGRFPWSPEYQNGHGGQPVLGRRTVE